MMEHLLKSSDVDEDSSSQNTENRNAAMANELYSTPKKLKQGDSASSAVERRRTKTIEIESSKAIQSSLLQVSVFESLRLFSNLAFVEVEMFSVFDTYAARNFIKLIPTQHSDPTGRMEASTNHDNFEHRERLTYSYPSFGEMDDLISFLDRSTERNLKMFILMNHGNICHELMRRSDLYGDSNHSKSRYASDCLEVGIRKVEAMKKANVIIELVS
jgi:hypothetical protein